MANSPFLSFMCQLIEFAMSMIELTFAQLLPTLVLLVGASLQFMFDFIMSLCYPNRSPSSSLLNSYPSNDAMTDDELYTDAEDDAHHHYFDSAVSRRQPLDTNRSGESWWPIQSLSAGASASHAKSPNRDGLMRREYLERRLGGNRQTDDLSMMGDGMQRRLPRGSASDDDDHFLNVDGTVRRTLEEQRPIQQSMRDSSRRGLARDGMLRRVPRGNASSLGNERLSDSLSNASGIILGNQSIRQWTNDSNGTGLARTHALPRRHMGLSQQSPSGPVYHSSTLLPSTSSSTWSLLRRSINKYAAKISDFFMSRIWRQSNNVRRPWEHRPLLQNTW